MHKEVVHYFIFFLLSFSLIVAGCAREHASANQVSPASRPLVIDNDTLITNHVKQALLMQNPKTAKNIHVQTENGVVQLSGFVQTKKQIDAAINTALKVQGVQSVKNSLILKKEVHSNSLYYKMKRSITYQNH